MLAQAEQAHQRRGLAGDGETEQVGQLTDADHQCRAQGEAEHHRMRNEIHQRTEAQQAEQPLAYASQQGQQQN